MLPTTWVSKTTWYSYHLERFDSSEVENQTQGGAGKLLWLVIFERLSGGCCLDAPSGRWIDGPVNSR